MALKDRMFDDDKGVETLPPPPGEEVEDVGAEIEDSEWLAAVAKKPTALTRKRKRQPRGWVQRYRDAQATLMGKVVRGESLTTEQKALLASLGRDGIDALRDEAASGWQAAIDPVLQPIIELAARATTPDELEQGLRALEGKLDVDALVRALATATFESRALGDGGKR